MKLYYAIAILARLLTAFLTGDKSQKSYMLYLWEDLFDREQPPEKTNQQAVSDYAIDKCLVMVLLAAASISASVVS
jgi:carbon starvation protein CstA